MFDSSEISSMLQGFIPINAIQRAFKKVQTYSINPFTLEIPPHSSLFKQHSLEIIHYKKRGVSEWTTANQKDSCQDTTLISHLIPSLVTELDSRTQLTKREKSNYLNISNLIKSSTVGSVNSIQNVKVPKGLVKVGADSKHATEERVKCSKTKSQFTVIQDNAVVIKKETTFNATLNSTALSTQVLVKPASVIVQSDSKPSEKDSLVTEFKLIATMDDSNLFKTWGPKVCRIGFVRENSAFSHEFLIMLANKCQVDQVVVKSAESKSKKKKKKSSAKKKKLKSSFEMARNAVLNAAQFAIDKDFIVPKLFVSESVKIESVIDVVVANDCAVITMPKSKRMKNVKKNALMKDSTERVPIIVVKTRKVSNQSNGLVSPVSSTESLDSLPVERKVHARSSTYSPRSSIESTRVETKMKARSVDVTTAIESLCLKEDPPSPPQTTPEACVEKRNIVKEGNLQFKSRSTDQSGRNPPKCNTEQFYFVPPTMTGSLGQKFAFAGWRHNHNYGNVFIQQFIPRDGSKYHDHNRMMGKHHVDCHGIGWVFYPVFINGIFQMWHRDDMLRCFPIFEQINYAEWLSSIPSITMAELEALARAQSAKPILTMDPVEADMLALSTSSMSVEKDVEMKDM